MSTPALNVRLVGIYRERLVKKFYIGSCIDIPPQWHDLRL